MRGSQAAYASAIDGVRYVEPSSTMTSSQDSNVCASQREHRSLVGRASGAQKAIHPAGLITAAHSGSRLKTRQWSLKRALGAYLDTRVGEV